MPNFRLPLTDLASSQDEPLLADPDDHLQSVDPLSALSTDVMHQAVEAYTAVIARERRLHEEQRDRQSWRKRAKRLILAYARDTAKWEEADRAYQMGELLRTTEPTAAAYMFAEAWRSLDSVESEHPSGLVPSSACAEARTRASEQAWIELMSGNGCLPADAEIRKRCDIFKDACYENERARERWDGRHQSCGPVIEWCEQELEGQNTEVDDEQLLQ